MDYQQLIDKYYGSQPTPLRNLLVKHSRSVAEKALRIGRLHPELQLDLTFVEEAAMLHDIGIFRCDAPGIYCHGTEPYICHGIIGAELLAAEGWPRHARVCSHHTGAGITREEIIAQNLPLPIDDYLPETMEEKLICYADKFFSKSHPDREKTVEQAAKSLEKFGSAGVARFLAWAELFGE